MTNTWWTIKTTLAQIIQKNKGWHDTFELLIGAFIIGILHAQAWRYGWILTLASSILTLTILPHASTALPWWRLMWSLGHYGVLIFPFLWYNPTLSLLQRCAAPFFMYTYLCIATLLYYSIMHSACRFLPINNFQSLATITIDAYYWYLIGETALMPLGCNAGMRFFTPVCLILPLLTQLSIHYWIFSAAGYWCVIASQLAIAHICKQTIWTLPALYILYALLPHAPQHPLQSPDHPITPRSIYLPFFITTYTECPCTLLTHLIPQAAQETLVLMPEGALTCTQTALAINHLHHLPPGVTVIAGCTYSTTSAYHNSIIIMQQHAIDIVHEKHLCIPFIEQVPLLLCASNNLTALRSHRKNIAPHATPFTLVHYNNSTTLALFLCADFFLGTYHHTIPATHLIVLAYDGWSVNTPFYNVMGSYIQYMALLYQKPVIYISDQHGWWCSPERGVLALEIRDHREQFFQ